MTTITLNNTPQAQDDLYTVATLNGMITEDGGTVTLSVMANDLGGKAKTLYSLDDGTENDGLAGSDLLIRDVVGFDNSSKSGALIEITADGKISYSMTAASTAKFQSLAEGEIGVDTFTYAIRLGNGTLSSATVTVEIRGTNDVPVITSMVQSGSVNEDGALTASGKVTSTDVDNGATATYSADASTSFAVDASTGAWTYTLDNAAAQAMAEGESRDETFAVTVTDDKGATATQNVTITITGTNDVPVITSDDQSGSVEEDGTQTASGKVTSTDVDNGATASYSGNADGVYGSFAIDAATGEWTYTLDNDAAQSLNSDETVTETYTVTVTDDKGGIATQDVTVSISGKNEALVVAEEAETTTTIAGPEVATVFEITVGNNGKKAGMVTDTTSYLTDAAGEITISGFDANDQLDVPTDWFLTAMVTQGANTNGVNDDSVTLSFDDVGGVATNDYEITLTGISSFDASVQLV